MTDNRSEKRETRFVRVGVLSFPLFDKGAYKVAIEKAAVTLWELRRKTSPFSKKYVPGCNASLLRTEAKRGRWIFRVKCSKPDSKPSGHIVRVRILKGKGRKMVTRDVQVSCSCPAWKYWGADFNAATGEYLEGSPRSDGSAPNVRDPNRTYLICKHVYTVGTMIREWAVPYAFEGEVQYRYRPRKKPKKEEDMVEEVEPGVPERRRVEPVEEPQQPDEQVESPPEEVEEPQQPDEEEGPQELADEGQSDEEDEDFPVYLL